MTRLVGFAGLVLALLGCTTVNLPDHKVCKTDKEGQEDALLPDMEGSWEEVAGGSFTEPRRYVVIPTTQYADRKACLASGKIPVVVTIGNSEWEQCVDKGQAPKGCD